MEAAKRFPPIPTTPNVVILAVPDEPALRAARDRLNDAVGVTPFHEPDLNDSLTALCSRPVFGRERRYFRAYPLLGG